VLDFIKWLRIARRGAIIWGRSAALTTSPTTLERPGPPRRHWPLAAALALFGLLTGLAVTTALSLTGGRLVYALDDPYIHMAMAKNAALHGVWGVTPHGFTSSSSSPLWTGLLALVYYVSWPSEAAPLVLNLAAGAAVLVAAHVMLLRLGIRAPAALAILGSVVLFTPMPGLCLFGLEHLLHAALVIAFARRVATAFCEERTRRRLLLLGLAAACLVGARYEGLFLAGPAVLLLLFCKNRAEAAVITAGAALPVVLYGAVSVSHGWWFLPNSVLLKGKIPDLRSAAGVVDLLGYGAYQQLVRSPLLLLLFLAALALLVPRAAAGTLLQPRGVLLLLFAANTALHFQLAKAAIFYRYEAYLVAFGLVTVLGSLFHHGDTENTEIRDRERWGMGRAAAAAVLALVPLMALAERGVRAWVRVPRSCRNVYEQQYHMARFLLQCSPKAVVAANDVGAIGYFTNVKLVDLWGLATMETGRAIRSGRYFLDEITAVTTAHGTQVALVYENRYRSGNLSGLPKHWIKVGEWTIRGNEALGEATVSVFAAEPSDARRLAECFRQFAPTMPAGVEVRVAAP